MHAIEKIYTALGSTFVSSIGQISYKLAQIKAYIFDWDGVFNDGIKSLEYPSNFSEIDAMGINLLRFSHWLKYQKLPFIAIITGTDNPSAYRFAQREKLHAIYAKINNKTIALEHFCTKYYLGKQSIAFVYDDVLDLSIAKSIQLRLMVKHNTTPLFNDYVIKKKWADYITAYTGGQHAIREVTELLINLNNNYAQTMTSRVDFDDQYQAYLAYKKQITTHYYQYDADQVSIFSFTY